MNTQENNKMIAEFMGMQHTDIGWYDNEETLQLRNNTFDELQFHKEWNWLMPVVHKCLDIYHTEQMNDDLNFEFYDGLSHSREATYKAVVEFINQYNKTK